jgi:hypothetical protein
MTMLETGKPFLRYSLNQAPLAKTNLAAKFFQPPFPHTKMQVRVRLDCGLRRVRVAQCVSRMGSLEPANDNDNDGKDTVAD